MHMLVVYGVRGAMPVRTLHDFTVRLLGIRLHRQSTDHHWTCHYLWIHSPTFPRRKRLTRTLISVKERSQVK